MLSISSTMRSVPEAGRDERYHRLWNRKLTQPGRHGDLDQQPLRNRQGQGVNSVNNRTHGSSVLTTRYNRSSAVQNSQPRRSANAR